MAAPIDVWSDGCVEAAGTKTGAMASFIKSIETLKGTNPSATKGVTDTAVQVVRDAVQQVADSSKETVSTAAEETNKQIQSAMGKAADKVTDTIKEFGKKMESK